MRHTNHQEFILWKKLEKAIECNLIIFRNWFIERAPKNKSKTMFQHKSETDEGQIHSAQYSVHLVPSIRNPMTDYFIYWPAK